MSGYKHATVTISQEEYRRLHDADMKRKFREYTNINEQASNQQDVNALLKYMEDRQRELEEALSSSPSNQTSSQYDMNVLQDIISRNAYYYDGLVASLQESNNILHDSISILSHHFEQIVQQEREEFHQRYYDLLTQQQSYQQSAYEKDEAARQWLNQCVVVLDFIQRQYDAEKFAPGKVATICRNLNMAELNLNDGFTESSLQFSQKSYLDLSDLNVVLDQATFNWQTEYARAYSSMRALVDQIYANSTVKALGLDGEELHEDVNLDFWTKGKYQQLFKHCQKYLEFMTQEQSRLSSDDLDRIYNQIIPTIRESFESIIYEARLQALNSQLRMNIAETALEALETHGFTLEHSGYSAEDMRSEFNAQLVCSDGTEINIQVLPTESENEELTNELVVITSHPYLKTEHEAKLRWEELNQTLNQYNLTVSRPYTNEETVTLHTEQNENIQTVEQIYKRTER